ncbi:uncharacterized protein LOC123554174 isoform X4 [Mercenaria mercenaria]|uniref:uncharacterized protein LOC123554174 isoform X4 n=1 Tax=Mercenaria mercenaria TaxID=6596 RepID=UPI001E1D5050|nr:uncharacterized protein LOC123554174 isoform X4 [Mercenaria mercenaria]
MVLPYELRSEHEWDPKIPKFPPVSPPIYMGFLRKKETVEDLMLSPRNQIFNRWKVPERMLESAPPGSKPFTPQEVETSVHVPSIPPTPAKAQGTPLPATPMAPKQKLSPAISRMSREMSLPNIKIKTTPVPRVESRNGLQLTGSVGCKTPKSAERPMRPEPVVPQRSKTMFVETPRKKSSAENGIRLNSALLPEAVPQAEEWMKHADKADKKVIERILKMASKKHELEKSLKKSLLPDAKDSVEKWMKDANAEGQDKEKERQVALNFFNSLAGGQLMGMTVESQRKRLKEVLNTLEETKPGVPSYGRLKKNTRRRKETISDGKLRYVRLLTPDTRENRWMHTTWHHLPEYRDDNIVNNWSSHYIRPHEPTPRHFVIHPDWG